MATKNTFGVKKAVRQARERRKLESNLTKVQKYDAIKRPIVTEKTMTDVDNRKYTFAVDERVTKPEIKSAIEEIYGVEIQNVRTVNVKKKPKRVGKYSGYRSGYKKAIIKLTESSKGIESFDM